MALSAVVNAFMDRLMVQWGFSSECPVVDDDNRVGQTPEDGAPYLTVQFPFSTTDRISFGTPGANTHREDGAARLVVHGRRGAGTVDARLWADALSELFRDKQFDGVKTFSPSSASTDDSNENGMYFVLAVVVPYHFDFLG